MTSLPAILVLVGLLSAGGLEASAAAPSPASSIPAAALIQPADLAASLKTAPAALLLHVGFRKLFDQAHIPGSEYAGPAADPAGLGTLRTRVAALPKDTAIVLYCGCCPWEHCPNVGAAFAELHRLGFSHVRVMYVANDFGTDWVDKGYPLAAGG